MKRFLALLLSIIFLSGCDVMDLLNPLPKQLPDDFCFSIIWNTFGISSYDSKTGELIKTTDASDPSIYKTTLNLSLEDTTNIYDKLHDLNFANYSETLSSSNFYQAIPYSTLSITVTTGKINKTLTANEVGNIEHAKNESAQLFLDTINFIVNIIESSAEWKALPDYEFLYD